MTPTQAIAECEPLVRSVAGRKFCRVGRHGIALDDLLQQGRLGVLRALPKYDPACGALPSFAWSYIVKEIGDWCQRESSPFSAMRAQGTDRAAERDAERQQIRSWRFVDVTDAADELLCDCEQERREDQRRAVAALMERPEREIGIVVGRLGDELFRDLGARFGVSRQRAQQLADEAINGVRLKLADVA